MVVLIDSNIIIDFLRNRKTETIFYRYFYLQENRAAISLISIVEIWQGQSMNNQQKIKEAEEFLNKVEIILPNIEIAKQSGTIVRNNHYQISFQDAEIAACALYHKLPLLTLNQKDFRKIKGIKLLPI